MADDVLDTHARIECAAFEAAYLEMTPPNPASRHFVVLVAHHRARLWAEHGAHQGVPEPSALRAHRPPEPGDWQRASG